MKAKRMIMNLLIVLLLLGGLGFLLYPRISDWLNRRKSSKTVTEYVKEVKQLSPADYSKVFEEAEEYNRRLRENPDPFSEEHRTEGYDDVLNIGRNGLMGYITIPKIHIQCPFYHGTDTEVLETAVGHLEGTSLPIGGPGTHAVLSAHRGLPSAKLFTDLAELVEGDRFTVTVLDRKLTYEVDQILTVLPSETEALRIEDGKDYCTLVTCTPYGINTHRLLVRGRRVEEAQASAEQNAVTETKVQRTETQNAEASETADAGRGLDDYIPFVVVLIIIIFAVILLLPGRRKKERKKDET